MHPMLLLTQMSIITTKIIHIYSSDNDSIKKHLNINARHEFGVEVWRCIICQAVQRMTEQESFLPFIQMLCDYGTNDEKSHMQNCGLFLSLINSYLFAKLDIDYSYMMDSDNTNTYALIKLISAVSRELIAKDFIYESNAIINWHNSGPVTKISPYLRLLLCEEVMFRKIYTTKGLMHGILSAFVIENENDLYVKLDKYLKRDCQDLWKIYSTDSTVRGLVLDFLDIMQNNNEAQFVVKYLNENIKDEDTIVCFNKERATSINLLKHVLGKVQVKDIIKFTGDTINTVLKFITNQNTVPT